MKFTESARLAQLDPGMLIDLPNQFGAIKPAIIPQEFHVI